MKKNATIYSVYNVQPSVMAARLKTIQGLRFREPRLNENNFCEVEIIGATAKQWQTLMRMW